METFYPWKIFSNTLTVYIQAREINKEALCNGIKIYEILKVLITLLKCDTLPSQMAQSMTASVSMGLPVEERDPLEIDF